MKRCSRFLVFVWNFHYKSMTYSYGLIFIENIHDKSKTSLILVKIREKTAVENATDNLDLQHTSSSNRLHLKLLQRYSLDLSHGLPTRPFSLAYRICFSLSYRLSAVDWSFKRTVYFFIHSLIVLRRIEVKMPA